MLQGLEPFLPGGESQAANDSVQPTEAAAAPADGEAAPIAVRGPIRSRQDVVQALDRICEYYDQIEPGSPVPFLLRRAQKLALMNFVEAVQELNLIAGPEALRPSMGSAVDGTAAASEAPAS